MIEQARYARFHGTATGPRLLTPSAFPLVRGLREKRDGGFLLRRRVQGAVSSGLVGRALHLSH